MLLQRFDVLFFFQGLVYFEILGSLGLEPSAI